MYKLGIIGFGTVGKSVLTFLNGQKCEHHEPGGQLFDDYQDSPNLNVQVWDARILSAEEKEMVKMYGAAVLDASTGMTLREFIISNDFVIVSPGIDLRGYQEFSNKFLCELDFFSVFLKKPVLAVTGSLGKTTTCKLLNKLISMVPRLPVECISKSLMRLTMMNDLGKKVQLKSVMGGNIGIGMLDLIKNQGDYDLGVLELSSFQLELNKKFAPDIALWTNFYPNHLDRHGTIESYFEAKFNLLNYQHERQVAILSGDLLRGQAGQFLNDCLAGIKSMVCICNHQDVDSAWVASIKRDRFALFFLRDGWLMCSIVSQGKHEQEQRLIQVKDLPDVTFIQNWVQIIAALYVIGINVSSLPELLAATGAVPLLDDHHHRVEPCGTIKGAMFYDDSKSTVIQATQAAVEKLAQGGQPLIVIVGGLSKGVDRRPLMEFLTQHTMIKKVYCFGKDCGAFADSSCKTMSTLEDVLQDIMIIVQPGDKILFSPSGSSFDLFKNYDHRGNVFKELVNKLAQANQ